MVRREFLKKIIKLAFTILILLWGAVFSVFVYPSRIRKKSLVFHYIFEEDSLPERGVRQVVVSFSKDGRKVRSRAFIVNTGDELFALSPVCSHLGCLVNWHRPKNRFLCPCHGGQYDMRGNVIKGPPPAPLGRLPLRIEGGRVFIGIRV